MITRALYLSTLSLVPLFFLNCSSNDSDGAQSIIPDAVAIVKATLPAEMESSAVSSVTTITTRANSDLQTLKDRLFTDGPTDFLYRISQVDSRLDDIAGNISGCESTATTTYTPPTIATGFSFPMEFSCKTTIDSTAQGMSDHKIYYGKSGGYWYVADIQTNAAFSTGDGEPPTMAVLSKIDAGGETAEIYQVSVEKVSSVYQATIMHIKADKTAGIFEVSTASSAVDGTETITPGANYTGVGCGVQMKTNGTLIYATGKFDQASSCPSTVVICTDASLVDTAGCTGVLDTLSVLDLLDRTVISGTQAKSLVVDRTWLSGL